MKLIVKVIILFLFINNLAENVNAQNKFLRLYQSKQTKIYSGTYDIIWIQKRMKSNETDSIYCVFSFNKSDLTNNIPSSYSLICNNGIKVIKIDSNLCIADKSIYNLLKGNQLHTSVYLSFFEDLFAFIFNANYFENKSGMSLDSKKNIQSSSKLYFTSRDTSNIVNFILELDTIKNSILYFERIVDTAYLKKDEVYYNSFIIKNQSFNDTLTKDNIQKELSSVLFKNGFNTLDKVIEINQFIFGKSYKQFPLINKPLNLFTVPLLLTNSDTIKLIDYKGKYLLIDFWSISCDGYLATINKINSIYEKYKGKNLMILSINPIDRNIIAIKEFSIRKNMKYLVCQAPKDFEKLLKISNLPSAVLISPDQKNFQSIKLQSNEDLIYFFDKIDNKLK